MTPGTQVTTASVAALLARADRLMDDPDSGYNCLLRLCRSDEEEGLLTLAVPHLPKISAGYDMLSPQAREYLGEMPENAEGALRFYGERPQTQEQEQMREAVAQEIEQYYLINRMTGHWGFSGEFGNGFAGSLMKYERQRTNNTPPVQLAALSEAATTWFDKRSQLGQFALRDLARYKGETVQRAMLERLPAELKQWMDTHPELPEATRVAMNDRLCQYRTAIQEIDTFFEDVLKVTGKSEKITRILDATAEQRGWNR